MNVTFKKDDSFVMLGELKVGQCFIILKYEKSKGKKVVWIKFEDDETDDIGEKNCMCLRLTGNDSGYGISFEDNILVQQINFDLVECS